jgi:hypothetical protein
MSLWCYIAGDDTPILVTTSSSTFIIELKDSIKEKRKYGLLKSVDAADLTLWKVRMTLVVIRSDIMGDTTLAYTAYLYHAI